MAETLFYDHRHARLTSLDEGPLRGLRHRTVLDRRGGAAGLALWQEEHLAGFHVPLHRHDCEEVITVLDGVIEAVVEDEAFRVESQQSILIPIWRAHGFTVSGGSPVRLLAIFSSPEPGIFRLDGTRSTPPWEGGPSGHLVAPR